MNIIIIGASSGIGRELAEQYAKEKHHVAVTSRRLNLLQEIQAQYPNLVLPFNMDVSDHKTSLQALDKISNELGSVDLIIFNAGIGFINPDLDFQKELDTINTNVLGFTAITDWSLLFLKKQGYGHFVGVSSIAALRGSGDAPAYSASKAFMANYLQALRFQLKSQKLNKIHITDIQPGFVDTAMAQGPGQFWVAPVAKAATQIRKAISKKKKIAYITKRWRLIAYIMKNILPS